MQCYKSNWLIFTALLCFFASPSVWADNESGFKTSKPKLLIIFDDMINGAQLKLVRSMKMNVNYAFIPPTKAHPHSAKIAESLDEYLVHLPLEAVDYANAEIDTLTVSDSIEVIEARIKQIKTWYPKAVFVNNHTGSRFTADKTAMTHLLRTLRRYRLQFIDSKTSKASVVAQLQPNHAMRPYVNDVFFDHYDDEKSIQAAMRRAVSIAKQRGFAIAIAHPRPSTVSAMKKYRAILNEVELIKVSQLPQVYHTHLVKQEKQAKQLANQAAAMAATASKNVVETKATEPVNP